MNRRLSLAALAATTTLTLLSGCASTAGQPPATVADAAAATPQLSTLNKLLVDAGLTDTLKGPGPFTVFAPTDDAFKAVPAKTLAELAADKKLLQSVLTYHVLPAAVRSDKISNGNVKTVQGANVAIAKAGSYVTVDEAMVTQADIVTGNGVVHIVDRVLIPPKR